MIDMAHDPRAAQVATNYIHVLREIQALGNEGFGVLLDTANQDEMDDLLIASQVLLEQIARVKSVLALNAQRG
jgi:hypothetical protein